LHSVDELTAPVAGACRTLAMLILGLGILAGLAGCNTHPAGGVQVVDRNSESAPRSPVRSGGYVVQRGDTLFGIAFKFGWDWKALAAHNGISEPYVIYPGQRITFGRNPSTRVAATPAARTTAPTTVASTPSTVTVLPPSTVQSAPRPVATPPAVTPSVATAPASTPVQDVKRSSSGWAWPASGTLIGRFSSNGSLNKGIDLAGELGQPVLAASSGTVVYAGSGLRGYGELVIIKHSDTFVSAYGHNRRLLVKEGQQVKVGQMIAEMGSTGTDRVKLHFEIRRQGKPVDPLQYLPAR
jgi:lipoprotein NlpD